MKIELQIEGRPSRKGIRTDRAAHHSEASMVLVRLAIDGEAGIGPAFVLGELWRADPDIRKPHRGLPICLP